MQLKRETEPQPRDVNKSIETTKYMGLLDSMLGAMSGKVTLPAKQVR
jgi:hypothetical protein